MISEWTVRCKAYLTDGPARIAPLLAASSRAFPFASQDSGAARVKAGDGR